MTSLGARPYMSIGEVLNALKDEFPDVTVSKIRFWESEGLISPERTSSGYRRFSALDLERLRFIARLQRDHFLPLKVIAERLQQWEASGGAETDPPPDAAEHAAPAELPLAMANEDPFRPFPQGVSMSQAELERASGLGPAEVDELRSYALLTPKQSDDGEARYNEIDLEVARLSRELIKLGLEPRHLRMFRSSVDRWAALAEQMVMPLVKQRNPEARRQAADTVRELVRVGNRLTQALLRDALSAYAPPQ